MTEFPHFVAVVQGDDQDDRARMIERGPALNRNYRRYAASGSLILIGSNLYRLARPAGMTSTSRREVSFRVFLRILLPFPFLYPFSLLSYSAYHRIYHVTCERGYWNIQGLVVLGVGLRPPSTSNYVWNAPRQSGQHVLIFQS
ncbi:hypothetical protein ACN38_g487 [Penicillium nordicum]|uniref:Uncharacterized protein n=1 Tax=Penicillium nordicum TaxID=229535 RepID=A0A0M8PAG2_9EURO|nr:hypothetical protein ACN38_g487 [Penicillium nordicum]